MTNVNKVTDENMEILFSKINEMEQEIVGISNLIQLVIASQWNSKDSGIKTVLCVADEKIEKLLKKDICGFKKSILDINKVYVNSGTKTKRTASKKVSTNKKTSLGKDKKVSESKPRAKNSKANIQEVETMKEQVIADGK